MQKSLLFVLTLIILVSGLTFGQELTLRAYGVSPYMVSQDTVEQYFDKRFTGVLNVGTETQMVLKGEFVDSTLMNPTWSVIQEPSSGAGVFGTTKDLDASTQLIKFTVGATGTYKVVFTDGTFADTVTINAGMYLGYENGAGCSCHQDKIGLYEQTGHSDMLVRGLEGTLSSHYGENCISCHTVGYDPDAQNDGFDDWPFVFPDSLFVGQYQNMVNTYPDAMQRANIQCESCHGPGSEHMGNITDSKIVQDIAMENCAYCHDDGHYHIFPSQWLLSKHGSGETLYGGSRTSCTPCHNGQGFIDKIKGEPQGIYEEIPITCATCHDPHDNSLDHQVRSLTATLSNGFEVTDAGMGGLCYNCHISRRDGVAYVEDYLNNLSSHYGPHHGPQGDMLLGLNTYTWGETLNSSPHYSATEDKCVSCHMADAESQHIPEAGGHTFRMVDPQGNDNVLACEPCHGNIGDEFNDKKFYVNGFWSDLDGDGIEEGVQEEMHGLLDILALLLPPVGLPDINVIDSTWTLDQAAGYYNYEYVLEDRSGGVHNPRFAYELLVLSIEKNGGVVSTPDVDGNLPVEFNLAQNYPNPFNPSTIIEYSLPEQSNIKIMVYDALGNQLEVLFSGENSAGTHSVTWNADSYASGIYFYRMQTENFTQVRKMLLMK